MVDRGYLLAPWFRQEDGCLLFAATGVGKTQVALTMALAVAGGGEVFGWTSLKPRKVLLIDGEMSSSDLRDRLVALAGTVSGIDREAARGNLKVIARHDQDPDTIFPDLGAEDEHTGFLNLVRRYSPDLLILDNLSTLCTMDDENSAGATQRVVKLLARLRQAKIGVLVVHHSGKSGKDYRGSSMLGTTFDAIIGLTKDKAHEAMDTTGAAKFDLEFHKVRAKRSHATGPRTVTLEGTPEGGLRWTAGLPSDALLDALAALVRTGDYGTQADVWHALPAHLKADAPKSWRSWLSRKFDLAAAKGILPKNEADKLFRAAGGREQGIGLLEDDLNDDL